MHSQITENIKKDIERATTLNLKDVVKFFTDISEEINQAENEIKELIKDVPNKDKQELKKEAEAKHAKLEEILNRVDKKVNDRLASNNFKEEWVDKSSTDVKQSFDKMILDTRSHWKNILSGASIPFETNHVKHEQESSWTQGILNIWNRITGKPSATVEKNNNQLRANYAKYRSQSAASKAYDDAIKSAGHAKSAATETTEAAKEKAKEAAYRAYHQVMSSEEYMKDKAYESYLNMVNAADYAKTAASETAESVKSKVNNAAHQAKEGTEYIKDKTQEGYEDIKNTADQVKNAAYETTESAKSKIKNTANQAYDQAKTGGEYLKEKTQEGYEDVKDTADQAKNAAYETADQAKNAAYETTESAKSKAKDAVHQTKKGTEYIKDKTYEGYEDTKEGVSNKWIEYSDYAQEMWESGKYNTQRTGDYLKESAQQGEENVKNKAYQGGQKAKDQWHQFQDQASSQFGYQQNPISSNDNIPKLDSSPAFDHYHQYHRSHFQTPVSAFYAALYALYFVVLARRVWNARKVAGIYTEDETIQTPILDTSSGLVDEKLSDTNVAEKNATVSKLRQKKLLVLNQNVSALQWFITSVPLMLILNCLLEANGMSKTLLHAFFVSLSSLLFMRNETGVGKASMSPSGDRAWADMTEYFVWGLFGVVGSISLYYSLTQGLSLFH